MLPLLLGLLTQRAMVEQAVTAHLHNFLLMLLQSGLETVEEAASVKAYAVKVITLA